MICSLDNTFYKTNTTFSIANTNVCTETYAFSTDVAKTIVIAFTDIVIDSTNPNNNIQLITSSSAIYAYCFNNIGNSFTFSAPRQQYVAIQRYGTVTASLAINFN